MSSFLTYPATGVSNIEDASVVVENTALILKSVGDTSMSA